MFSDKWAHPFDPNRNEIKPFYGLNGTTKSEMMVNYGRDFKYEIRIIKLINKSWFLMAVIGKLPLLSI